MPQVVLVEDDPAIRAALTRTLQEQGHGVRAVSRGLDAIAAVMETQPDVVVLDLGLPDIDGADVLAMIRAVSTVPVIIATARDDEREVVRLLHAGADDYVVKPFGAAQIDARIRAVLRRGATSPRMRRSASGACSSIRPAGRRTSTGRRSTCPARSSTCCSCWPAGWVRS